MTELRQSNIQPRPLVTDAVVALKPPVDAVLGTTLVPFDIDVVAVRGLTFVQNFRLWVDAAHTRAFDLSPWTIAAEAPPFGSGEPLPLHVSAGDGLLSLGLSAEETAGAGSVYLVRVTATAGNDVELLAKGILKFTSPANL